MWNEIIVPVFTNVLLYIYQLVGGNLGIAILLFTLLVRLLTHPLMVSQIRGTQAMQSLQSDPRYKEIQEKYKDDREKLSAEQMKLTKELGVNPLSSCLPTFIQLPIMIAFYQGMTAALASTPIQLFDLTRHLYPWLLKVEALIPLNSRFLWMDLGQPERLNLPFLSFGIPVLTILVVITTFLQSKLMAPPNADPKDPSAQTANIMNIYMPILMGWFAYTLSGGLALYFVVSNLLGIAQYAMLGRLNWSNLLPKGKPVGGQKPASKSGDQPRKSVSKSGKSGKSGK